ncbi:MAG: preprotein translocase subunit SecF [Parcubacteria group bacterium ADurb.Bin326]|nr:MAG: preprotein translocase subunit SecF [Parcubacteria group bacterium ADurb.Bin326]
MKLQIIKNRKYPYLLSGILVLASVLSLIAWGLKPGLDFTGGSLLEVSFSQERPEVAEVNSALNPLNFGDLVIQPSGDKNIIIKSRAISEEEHQAAVNSLKKAAGEKNELSEIRFDSIGPVIGKELLQKSIWMLIIASLAIIAYIAYVFRKVSRPLASWKYGTAAVIALLHDVLIITGIFSALGHFRGIEVDSLFITALLTIIGFSVHDTIVVFDRTRENLSKFYSGKFDEVVNDSVNQTLARSINTSLTTLLVLLALLFFGGNSIKNFTLALSLGIVVGTYSSIFIASPLIVDWNNFSKKGFKK